MYDHQPTKMGFTTRMLRVGAGALAIGALLYFASRGIGGGWPGILLSGTFSWFGFELVLSFVRAIGREQTRIQPRHAILGGCLALVAACGAGGLLLFFGQQLVWGLILGGVTSFVTHRTQLPTLAQISGVKLISETAGASGPSIALLPPRPVVATAAVLCLLAGVALGGLGTIRLLENYSYTTDIGCAHPCGMMRGLWVQVLPDAQGDFVTRLDATAVQVRLRFSDDVAGAKTANRSGFTLTNPPAVYEQVVDRQGCDAWAPRELHIGDSTANLSLCFAIPQSQEVDLSQLVLNWTEADATAPILLGKKAGSNFGIDVSTG